MVITMMMMMMVIVMDSVACAGDEKDNDKCVKLGNSWIDAMETNLTKMEANLEEKDKIKHKDDIQSNRDHLNSLKGKNSSEWREYATKCMIEIMDNKV